MDIYTQPNKLLARSLQTVAFILIVGKRLYKFLVSGQSTIDEHLLQRAADIGIILLIISAVAELYDRYLDATGRWLTIIGAALVGCGIFITDVVAHTDVALTNTQMLVARIVFLAVGGLMALYAAGKREMVLEELNEDSKSPEA